MNTLVSNKGTITWSASIHLLLCYATNEISHKRCSRTAGTTAAHLFYPFVVFKTEKCVTLLVAATPRQTQSTQSVPLESRGIFAFWPNGGA